MGPDRLPPPPHVTTGFPALDQLIGGPEGPPLGYPKGRLTLLLGPEKACELMAWQATIALHEQGKTTILFQNPKPSDILEAQGDLVIATRLSERGRPDPLQEELLQRGAYMDPKRAFLFLYEEPPYALKFLSSLTLRINRHENGEAQVQVVKTMISPHKGVVDIPLPIL